jgi:two-component system, sensor histidine kinase
MARTGSDRRRKKKAKRAVPRRPRQRPAAGLNDIALAAYAHDIRTALTGILAFGELLVSSNLGERERQWAAGINASAEHLAALTSLAIDSAKAEVGSLTLQQEAFRLRRLSEALADSLSVRAQMKGLAVEISIAGDLPELVLGDAVRLRAALENLVDNAIKFTSEGGVRLDVHASQSGRGRAKFIFTLTDSGIGLTAAEMKRLFRPFTQANAEIARRFGGTGLGLAVVKRLARLMGGDLSVSSKPGGSRFRFTATLPLASKDAATGTPARRPISRSTQRLSILCVEDNPYGRVILNTILTELGHQVDFAGSGEEAMVVLPRGYDVVLMDVILPGIDGLETARRIRALPGATEATPIIGISGRSEGGGEEAARAAGMNYYLLKPISPSALSEALAAVTRSSSESPTVQP